MDVGSGVGLRREIGWNIQAKLCGDTLYAVLRMPQSIGVCHDLDAWLRPDRLQTIGAIKCEFADSSHILKTVARDHTNGGKDGDGDEDKQPAGQNELHIIHRAV